MESVQQQWLPSPNLFSTGEHAIEALVVKDDELCKKLQATEAAHRWTRFTDLQERLVDTTLQQVKKRLASVVPPQACQVPLDYRTPDCPQRLALAGAEAVLELLLHTHRTGTCTPAGVTATDSNCRMRMPRIMNYLTSIEQNLSGAVHLKRYGRTLVAHITSLLLALPCNHTFAFAADLSRFMRTRELWDQQHAHLPPDSPLRARRPQLPSLEEQAADVADYALKYATKAEPMQGGAAATSTAPHSAPLPPTDIITPLDLFTGLRELPLASIVSTTAESPTTLEPLTAAATVQPSASSPHISRTKARGKYNLAHAINIQTAHSTYFSPDAALLLLLNNVAVESHTTQPIDYRLFGDRLLPESHVQLQPPETTRAELVPAVTGPSTSTSVPVQPDADSDTDSGGSQAEEVSDADDTPPIVQPAVLPVVPTSYEALTRMKDYLLRGPGCRNYSPVVMAMLFYKRNVGIAKAAAAHADSRLARNHPQYATHIWTRREHLAIPQPLSDPPPRPSPNCTDRRLRQRYAAFALGNFAAYTADADIDTTADLWETYERYFLTGDNATSLQEQAEAALMEGVVPLENAAVEAPQDDVPYDPPLESPPSSAWIDHPANDAAQQRIIERYTTQGAPLPSNATPQTRYVDAALSTLPVFKPSTDTNAKTLKPAQAATRSPCSFTDETLASIETQQNEYDATALPPDIAQPNLQLLNRNTPALHAQLLVVKPDGTRTERVYPNHACPGEPPPYVLLPSDQLPTPDETIALFTLSDDQAAPFRLYADVLQAEKAGRRLPPITAILTGKPGTGKSQVVLALLWFAFQHRCTDLVAVVSYTWRAALHDTTPGNIGITTTTFFATAGRFTSAVRTRLERNLSGVRLIVMDEFSTCSLAHMGRIFQQVHIARQDVNPGADDDRFSGPLADIHGLFVGDPRQLEQPQHAPIYAGAARADLKLQHTRQLQAAGQQADIATTAAIFSAVAPDVEAALHELKKPSGVNENRLLPLHAYTEGQQLLVWRSVDLAPDGAPLPTELLEELETIGGTDDDGTIPALGAFFHGIRYTFTTNAHPAVHHIHNNSATGVAIILHPEEPKLPDPSTARIHILRYVPRAIIVRPDGGPLGRVSPDLQPGEVLVRPKYKTFTPTHATNAQSVHRWGFNLDYEYSTTDYFAEGLTFRNQTWLAHLSPPPTGQWHRASMYVIPTRFTSMDSFHLLAPMWSTPEEKPRVLKRILKLAEPVPDLQAEWERLCNLADFTRQVLPRLLNNLATKAP
ncbi:hypothetical protein PLESTB_000670800 [Pleodorina starrii]|uniref:Uncharacterized protein n=1 Tax=Pleodorina starrii TaxID=330485 RepID=A0A9W6BJM6_9CHLO|nr:hypothetical protein PLESTB_000670800 [Pleodorina starrii]